MQKRSGATTRSRWRGVQSCSSVVSAAYERIAPAQCELLARLVFDAAYRAKPLAASAQVPQGRSIRILQTYATKWPDPRGNSSRIPICKAVSWYCATVGVPYKMARQDAAKLLMPCPSTCSPPTVAPTLQARSWPLEPTPRRARRACSSTR